MRGVAAERLRELLDYDPLSGLLTWRKDRNQLAKKGSVAGNLHVKGYVHVKVDGKEYKAHRLAWVWMTGEFPPDQVDHINGCKSDNRWSNIRLANNAENQRNVGTRKDNKSGTRGVTWHERQKKWIASIRVDGRLFHLGSFDTIEEATAMRKGCEPWLLGEFAPCIIVNNGVINVER